MQGSKQKSLYENFASRSDLISTDNVSTRAIYFHVNVSTPCIRLIEGRRVEPCARARACFRISFLFLFFFWKGRGEGFGRVFLCARSTKARSTNPILAVTTDKPPLFERVDFGKTRTDNERTFILFPIISLPFLTNYFRIEILPILINCVE